MTWKMTGTYFESCNCETACPCVFLSPPTEDDCTVLVGWHIDEGNLDGVALDGLNVAMAAHVDGNMISNPWTVALYLDDRATEDQMGALGQIFSGQLGGVPAALGEHIGTVLGAGPAPITFEIEGTDRSMSIGDVASVKVMAMAGQGGGPVEITGHPLAIAPGNSALVGHSDHLRYNDYGMTWELAGKNAFTAPFQYEG